MWASVAPARRIAQGTANERGYDWKWRKFSERFRRTYPLCGMRPGGLAPVMSQCWEEGRVTPAKQVDHVVPHRGDPEKFWPGDAGFQSLCDACGKRKTAAGL